MLKDDKTYPYIKINIKDKYPIITELEEKQMIKQCILDHIQMWEL